MLLRNFSTTLDKTSRADRQADQGEMLFSGGIEPTGRLEFDRPFVKGGTERPQESGPRPMEVDTDSG
jgi:hypothetical protein